MNWYKLSFDLETLNDRNSLNARISEFKEAVRILRYMVDYVFQNAAHARKIILSIANNKKMSSYPSLKDTLIFAANKALDNYKECSVLCGEVADTLFREVEQMVKQRKDFSENIYPRKTKERWDAGKEKSDSKKGK